MRTIRGSLLLGADSRKFRCWPLFSVIQFCCCIVLFLFCVIYDVHVLFLESYWRFYLLSQYGLTPIEIAALQCDYQGVVILFPVTSRIPAIPDWSTVGIMKYIHSEDATRQVIKCNPPLRSWDFEGNLLGLDENILMATKSY